MPAVLESPEPSTESNFSQVQDELLGMLQRAGQPPARPQAERPAAAPSTPAGGAAEVPERGKKAKSAKAAAQATGKQSAKAEPEAEPVDPNITCVKCGNLESWKGSSWCPKCGYYPTLNHDGAAPLEEPDGLENLTMADLCPAWAVQIVLGIATIIGLTAVLEHSLGTNIGLLSLASLVQLSFGLVLMLLAHKQAIMSGLQDPGCPGVFALIAYPPSVWMPVIKHIKQRANLLVMLAWGVAASGSALAIYGPIHMDEISKELKATRAERAKEKPLMGKMLGTMTKLAVAGSAAANGGGAPPGLPPGADGSLEDAIGGFAGLATEAGGLGDIANGAAGGQVNGAMGDLGGLGGGSGAGGAGIEGAIGDFAGLAVGQTGLDDPNKMGAAMMAGANSAGGGQGTSGGSGTVAPPRTDTGSSSGVKSFVAAPGTNGRSPASGGGTAGAASAAGTIAAPLAQAIVFGYLTNSGGDIRTLLIARQGPDGRPRFAGKLSSDAVGANQWSKLIAELPTLRTQRPLVACPNAGQWVEPRYVLSLTAERWTSTGPVDAQVQSVERR